MNLDSIQALLGRLETVPVVITLALSMIKVNVYGDRAQRGWRALSVIELNDLSDKAQQRSGALSRALSPSKLNPLKPARLQYA